MTVEPVTSHLASPAALGARERSPDRLRVLFISKRFLYPMDTGGKIRTGKLLEQLSRELEITLVSNVEAAKDGPYLPHMASLCRTFHSVSWAEIPKYTPRFYLSVLASLLSRYPVTVVRDYSKPFAERIASLLRQHAYDLVVCDFLQPSLNLRGLAAPPTLLFQHNVESMILKRHADTAPNPLLRLFWLHQWRKMQRYERETCARFAGVVAVSDLDGRILREQFGARCVFTIPTGVDVDYFRPHDVRVDEPTLIFTGSMDWLPNEDAIAFFAEQILGPVQAAIPGVTLTVVGRNPSRRLLARLKTCPQIRLTGWVNDVRPYLASHAVCVVPLRIGGGTRIKMYEAMAMGKAIVSTPVGVEGLPVRHPDNILIAEHPSEFAAAVVHLLTDLAARRRIEVAARAFVELNCSWRGAAAALAEACRTVAGG